MLERVRDLGLDCIEVGTTGYAGNPLHPTRVIAQERHAATLEKTVLPAERLEAPVINLLSGCPGDSRTAHSPNWRHSAWPPEYPELWAWQWNEAAIRRAYVAYASGEIEDRRAVEPLRALLQGGARDPRRSAEEALAKLAGDKSTSRQRREVVDAPGPVKDP